MIIYRPIKSPRVSQPFGANYAICKCAGGGDFPIIPFIVRRRPKYTNKIPRGWRLWYPFMGLKGHNGVDRPCWDGELAYFPIQVEGVEWYAMNEKESNGGVWLHVLSRQPINGHYRKYTIGHLKESLKSDGEKVIFGQPIAKCNNTGASSGHHVHEMLKDISANGQTLNKDNGHNGAIDMDEWYKNVFVLEVMGVRKSRVRRPVSGYLKYLYRTWIKYHRLKN